MTARIDDKWLRLQIDRANYSLRGFAEAIGMDPASLQRTLKGARRLQLDEAQKIADVLSANGVPTDLTAVLAHAGLNVKAAAAAAGVKAAIVKEPEKAPLGGVVDATTGEVRFIPTKDSRAAAVVALAIQGDPFMDGWRVLCQPSEVGAAPVDGLEAGIVQTREGKLLLRKIRPSFAAGRYDLGPVFGFGGRENDVEVVGVVPVVGLER